MSSIARRVGTKLANFLERSTDPGLTANQVKLYSKDDGGTTQFFAQDSAGTVHQLTPSAGAAAGRELVAEQWNQNNVAASQAAVDLETLISQHFANTVAVRAGSIVGMITRFSETITDATASSAIVTVTVNGAAGTLAVTSTSGVNPDGGQATQATGTDAFVAGDTLGFEITTLSTFAPVTTDLEVSMEIDIN